MIVHPRLSEERFTKAIEPLLAQPTLFEGVGVRLVRYVHPRLYVDLRWNRHDRWVRLCVDAMDFNYRPLSGWFVDEAHAPLLAGRSLAPAGLGFQPQGPPFGEPRGWFCFRGWREYHEHESHCQEAPWSTFRADPKYGPLGLIKQLQSDLQRDGVTST